MVARLPSGPLEIHCVHVPNAANGWVKVETLQALRRGLEPPTRTPRVLCGDLNTPRRELPDGTAISFARDSHGRLRPERGAEWDAAELGIVPGLRDLGYRDAFRTCRGYESRSPSWTWKTIAGHDGRVASGPDLPLRPTAPARLPLPPPMARTRAKRPFRARDRRGVLPRLTGDRRRLGRSSRTDGTSPLR